jgi:hypothetical protein
MTSLTRRQLFVLCITEALGGVRMPVDRGDAVLREFHGTLTAFELTSPHGLATNFLDHLVLPGILEQIMFKVKLLGLSVDEERFFSLMDMVHTERYLDDPAYAGQVHAGLRAICDAGHDQRHTFLDTSQKS